MSEFSLNKTEARLLSDAADREGGALALPGHLKPTGATRLLGRLVKHGLIVTSDVEGEAGHRLTAAGYKATGRAPQRTVAGTKRDLVAGLLGRGQGATLNELIAATGWLPHTTRAALSRLRSGGTVLTKSAREDGRTAYRIESAESAAVAA